MQTSLTYGRQAVIHFDISDSALLLDRRGPDGEPLDDPAAAVAAALATPENYPALASAVTSDDRVTIALGPGVPQAEAVIAGIVYTLAEGDVAENRITILQTAEEAGRSGRDVMAGLPDHARRRIQLAVHDPADRKSLSYLAADAQGQPIYFNRHLCDADLVIPVGCLRTSDGPGHSGVSVGIYPTFADDAAQRRFAAVSSSEDPVHRRRRDEQADEAVWLLGAMFTLQLLPGAGDTVLHVLAGERGAVVQRGRELCEQVWSFNVPERASLVIATVEGGSEQQSWENFARALHAASQAVADDGAIAVCMELEDLPGPALQRLAAADDESLRDLRRDRTSDAIAAAQLQRILETNQVYLLSRLQADVVESLGLAHVSSAEEISRLSSRHRSCILLGNAQFAAPRAT